MVSRAAVKIEAKSLDQAIVKAAGQLGITQEQVGYNVLKEGSGKSLLSFFGGRPKVEIEAWDKLSNNAPVSAPRNGRSHSTDSFLQSEAPKLTDQQVADLRVELREFCTGICERMAQAEVKITDKLVDNRLILDIDSDFMAQQITKHSKLAEAMEHILRKKPRHLKQELPFRIFIDVRGLRLNREDELIQMAHDLSDKVHENKRPIVLNYKSSYDRKIIHMALDKDERVYTKSIGTGANRKLMILPTREQEAIHQDA